MKIKKIALVLLKTQAMSAQSSSMEMQQSKVVVLSSYGEIL